MSAFEFILLMLFIIGLLTTAYYASICLPVVLEKSRPRQYVDPERNYLIPPERIDVNENKPEPVSTAPVGFVDDDIHLHLNPDDSYPNATSKNLPLKGEESFAKSNDAASTEDVDKHACTPVPCEDEEVPQTIRQLERLQQCRAESDRNAPERASLLRGDDEDGLIVCEPSVRSKNTGEPIPPTCAKPAHVIVPIVAAGMLPPQPADQTEEDETQPMNLSCKPSSAEHIPSHTVVSAPEPQNVPPAMSMSQSHPPSHMVVTVPQPLNAPPLMVAPVYDEPSGDEQSTVSLQQQLHPVTVTVHPSEDPENTHSLKNQADDRPSSESPYGWAESVTKAEDPSARNEDLSASVKDDVEERPNVLLASQMSDTATDSPTPSEGIPEICPSVDHASSAGTDSSEPEITEYSFEIGPLVPSTNLMLEDEISSVPNVQVLSYVSLDESSIVETEASTSDSTRVHVGDPCTGSDAADLESSDGQLGEGEEADGIDELDEIEEAPHASNAGHHSPDLLRRSPDGDSVKSTEIEACSPPNSPQKETAAKSSEKPPHVEGCEASSDGGQLDKAKTCEDPKVEQSKPVAESAV